MYKVISKITGSIRVNGKELGYNGFIIVSKITDEISNLQMNKIVKVKEIKLQDDKLSSVELLAGETITTENKKNKKNKSILGGN